MSSTTRLSHVGLFKDHNVTFASWCTLNILSMVLTQNITRLKIFLRVKVLGYILEHKNYQLRNEKHIFCI